MSFCPSNLYPPASIDASIMTVSPFTTPLSVVSGDLIQAISSSSNYHIAAQQLLALTWHQDARLSNAIEAQPTESGADYFLNPGLLLTSDSQEIFLAIRAHKEMIESQFPLLSHAASLIDYVAQYTTNLLPMMSREKNRLASTSAAGEILHYHSIESELSFEWSIALYMGLSPFPTFGVNIPYGDERVVRFLRRFGFGAFVYLSLACDPELARDGNLPLQMTHEKVSRPVASVPVRRGAYGSISIP